MSEEKMCFKGKPDEFRQLLTDAGIRFSEKAMVDGLRFTTSEGVLIDWWPNSKKGTVYLPGCSFEDSSRREQLREILADYKTGGSFVRPDQQPRSQSVGGVRFVDGAEDDEFWTYLRSHPEAMATYEETGLSGLQEPVAEAHALMVPELV